MTSPKTTNFGTRYFYTDPLAAAWMAKHFGMEYRRGDQCIIGWQDFVDLEYCRWDGPFYLHADSVRLLEPQVGDLASDGNHVGLVLAVSDSIVTVACPERHNGKEHYCFNRDHVFVMQREKKPFHWPNWEAA